MSLEYFTSLKITAQSIRQRSFCLMAVLILPVLSIIFTACRTNTATKAQLDRAESIMEEYPDSALTIIEGISQNSLKDNAAKARYALLKSMAIDKTGIDTTVFDILQPAIDYYQDHGTPNDKLRTYYYQGRIFQNREDYTSAMTAFVRASDFKDQATDSLAIARLLIAQGVIYYNEYKAAEFIANNLQAAEIYKAKSKKREEVDRYLAALEGYFILENKEKIDSILNILKQISYQDTQESMELNNYLISYFIEYENEEELSKILKSLSHTELPDNDIKLNVARAYLKLNDPTEALNYLETVVTPEDDRYQFHKYLILKMEALESKGYYKEAYEICREYYSLVDEWHHELFKNDLLFAEQRHNLETAEQIKLRDKDHIIYLSVLCILVLIIISGIIYYYYHRAHVKKIITEKEKQALELEHDRQLLETENLRLEISQLETESKRLQQLLEKRNELDTPLEEVLKTRLNMLNSLLAKEISANESHAKPYREWVESLRKDKEKFLQSTRLAFQASHPTFIKHLEDHSLTIDEINFVCLHALGLSGKEIGHYLNIASHYNISSTIRRKLELNNETIYLSKYIQRLL